MLPTGLAARTGNDTPRTAPACQRGALSGTGTAMTVPAQASLVGYKPPPQSPRTPGPEPAVTGSPQASTFQVAFMVAFPASDSGMHVPVTLLVLSKASCPGE